MQLRLSTATASALALSFLLFGSCSSSSGGDPTDASRACDPSSATKFCLLSCSLGCTRNGCSVTDISQNQPIVLDFSQDVDPSSVNAATISLKTANGRTPTGRFEVAEKRVVFVPDIKFVGGNTEFGFSSGETYFLTLPASTGSDTLRSVSGVRLGSTITCSLSVTQGIVDLNAKPPEAKMISPSATSNVPPNAVIILEFDEFIDVAPFRGSTTETSPITYVIRKTRPKANQSDVRECDPNFTPITLEGLPKAEIDPVRGTTIVTLQPSVPLPSQICVEIGVTSRVKDLAGRSAVPEKFTFTTEIVAPGVGQINEQFATDSQLDKAVSSGIWGGGKALPPKVGGTGVHGSFQASTGTAYFDTATQQNWFIWSTDKQAIPKELTQSGQPEEALNGVFHFSDFNLPEGVQVVFAGSNPAVINVRGKCQIDGKLALGVVYRDVNQNIERVVLQPDTPGGVNNYNGKPNGPGIGQPAQRGGPGGGRGGKGGDACLNTGANAKYNGANGDDVQLKSGHSYAAQAKGTGGRGAPLYPSKGKLTANSADYDVLNAFSAYTSGGGGGGGFNTQGGQSEVFQVAPIGNNKQRVPNDSIRMGPKIAGGKAFDPSQAAPAQGHSSLDHFLIGGPGGGGGGSHALLISDTDKHWQGAAAGSGGGGAIAFRVGQDMAMGAGGLVSARGGSGFVAGNENDIFNLPCPGGGGGGGTILLQVFGDVSLAGKLDTSGGKGGAVDNTKSPSIGTIFGTKATAGDGSPGYVRLERPGGAKVIELGSTVPTATSSHVGTLNENDADVKSASQSKFYSTRLTFPPTFLRYEMEVILDGTTRKLYSDDADVGEKEINGQPNPIYDEDYAGRADSSQPVWFRLQGATVSTVTGLPDLQTAGPWREFAKGNVSSINLDQANGFRFLLTFDTSTTQSIEVRRVTVFFAE